jgi:twitching motility two-component system response regulator PilH
MKGNALTWCESWLLACKRLLGQLILKSILLVDDSRLMRIANERALVRAGYNVVTASDGEEALLIASARIPDLILLDMLLPKLGGHEVLQSLRKNPLTASIPVIVMSSLPQTNEAKLLRAGATAYVEKSKMGSNQPGESLLGIVKKTLDCAVAPEVPGSIAVRTSGTEIVASIIEEGS